MQGNLASTIRFQPRGPFELARRMMRAHRPWMTHRADLASLLQHNRANRTSRRAIAARRIGELPERTSAPCDRTAVGAIHSLRRCCHDLPASQFNDGLAGNDV